MDGLELDFNKMPNEPIEINFEIKKEHLCKQ